MSRIIEMFEEKLEEEKKKAMEIELILKAKYGTSDLDVITNTINTEKIKVEEQKTKAEKQAKDIEAEILEAFNEFSK